MEERTPVKKRCFAVQEMVGTWMEMAGTVRGINIGR